MQTTPPPAQGLYDPAFEHDACGVAFVVDLHGTRSHDLVEKGITALVNLDHRGASGAETNTGDGAGILIQIPDAFYRDVAGVALPPAGHYATGIAFVPSADAQVAWQALARRQPAPGRRVIFGHSMGGAVAVRLASGLRSRPAQPDYRPLSTPRGHC